VSECAAEALETAQSLHPSDERALTEALTLTGRAYELLDGYDLALDAFDEAVQVGGSDVDTWPLRYERANTAFQAASVAHGDVLACKEAFLELLEGEPDVDRSSTALAAAGMVALFMKQYDEAGGLLTKAIEPGEDYAWAYALLGRTWWFLHENAAAARCFLAVLADAAADPVTSSDALVGLELLETVRGFRSTEDRPAVSDELERATHPHRALSMDNFEYYDGAEAVLRADLDAQHASSFAHNALAWFLLDRRPARPGVFEEVIELAGRAVELEADSVHRGNHLDTLGWAQYLSGDRAGALATLEQAHETAPLDLEIRAHLETVRADGRR
jgi:tetratricopeptide (TPR) repeat protein